MSFLFCLFSKSRSTFTENNFQLKGHISHHCKACNICGIKFSRSNENDELEYFNFGGHDIEPESEENFMQICNIFFLIFY